MVKTMWTGVKVQNLGRTEDEGSKTYKIITHPIPWATLRAFMRGLKYFGTS